MTKKDNITKNKFTDEDLFVLYSPPNDANHYLIKQDDAKVVEIKDYSSFEGFIIEPFQREGSVRPIYIRKDQYEVNPFIEFHPQQNFERVCIGKEDYLKQVEYFRTQCENGNFDKVVLSRIKKIGRDDVNLMPLFLSLKQKYPNAFIYLMNIPGMSCWIGATPEILLTKTGNTYRTMALAGTMATNNSNLDSINWGAKEIHEQAIVESYFEEILNNIEARFIKDGPKSKRAGNLLHICTSFEFETEIPLTNILDAFHPSPAVCGLPKNKSVQFIKNVESHDRRYYTGFLGTLNEPLQSDFFVNLRCMEVSKSEFFLYVGGGITKGSIPESEWQETELKSFTLQSIIEKMYLYADVIR